MFARAAGAPCGRARSARSFRRRVTPSTRNNVCDVHAPGAWPIAPDVRSINRNVIVLPFTLDVESATELRARLAVIPAGASIVFDGSRIRCVDPAGTEMLCAQVLAAEGRGVMVTWIAVSSVFVTYVNLLGFGGVMRFDCVHREVLELSAAFT